MLLWLTVRRDGANGLLDLVSGFTNCVFGGIIAALWRSLIGACMWWGSLCLLCGFGDVDSDLIFVGFV